MIQTLFQNYDVFHTVSDIHRRSESNPFRILQLDCVSVDEDPELAEFKDNFYKKQEIIPIYKPEKKRLDSSEMVMTYAGNLFGEVIIR